LTSGVDRRVALIVVTLSSFLTSSTLSAVNIALPSIGRDLGLSAVVLGWIPTIYSIATAICLLPMGRVADIVGRKRVFVLGIAIFGIASFFLALSPSAGALLGLRVCQGIGGSMIFSTGTAILTSIYPADEKGRVLGITTAAVYVGLSVGPTLGGILTEQLGWRSVFLVNTPLAAAIILLVFWRLRGEWAEARGDTFDMTGTVIYGVALLAILYGFSSLPEVSSALLIVVGLAAFGLFVWWEKRTPSPLLDIGLFTGNLTFALSNLAALINYSATAATSFLLSLYLQQIRGFDPEVAGLILIAQPIVQAVFSPLTGHLSDTIEPRILASAGMALTALSLFIFATLDPATPIVVVILVLMLLGLGFGLFSSPNTNAVMSAVDRRSYGIASATLSTMRTLGNCFSIGTTVVVFAVLIGHVEITPDAYPALMTSTRLIFSIFAVLCVLGVVASLARGNLHEAKPSLTVKEL
jgi:EmrB/QacA subfamily drug resistance transporter